MLDKIKAQTTIGPDCCLCFYFQRTGMRGQRLRFGNCDVGAVAIGLRVVVGPAIVSERAVSNSAHREGYGSV